MVCAVIMDRLCEKCREEFEEKLHVNRLLELAVERNHLLRMDLYITAAANINTNITAGAHVSIATGADVNSTVGASELSE